MHKWVQFKDHIKRAHHIEENEIGSSDESPPISPTIIPTLSNERTQSNLKSFKTSAYKRGSIPKDTASLENSNTIINLNNSRDFKNDVTNPNGENIADDEEDMEFYDLIQNMSDEDSETSTESYSKVNFGVLPQSLENVTITKINAVPRSPEHVRLFLNFLNNI